MLVKRKVRYHADFESQVKACGFDMSHPHVRAVLDFVERSPGLRFSVVLKTTKSGAHRMYETKPDYTGWTLKVFFLVLDGGQEILLFGAKARSVLPNAANGP